MTATAALTTDLQRQVLALETDLRDRLAADPEREGEWKREHHRAVERERTAAGWAQWRDDRVTQSAVAWVLTTVFIRFCEDNALLKPVWITGGGSRRQEALDAQLDTSAATQRTLAANGCSTPSTTYPSSPPPAPWSNLIQRST